MEANDLMVSPVNVRCPNLLCLMAIDGGYVNIVMSAWWLRSERARCSTICSILLLAELVQQLANDDSKHLPAFRLGHHLFYWRSLPNILWANNDEILGDMETRHFGAMLSIAALPARMLRVVCSWAESPLASDFVSPFLLEERLSRAPDWKRTFLLPRSQILSSCYVSRTAHLAFTLSLPVSLTHTYAHTKRDNRQI